ncbi:ATP-binding protein [Streptomyces roseicoloratus]|uniref:ATP-binding protein n=1 Tax=Streptomyces roseicoloratus TaxID=2508722 RepID=UPI0010099EE0|nr:ATP-binding protein [Streptomyces roseicoloratus]
MTTTAPRSALPVRTFAQLLSSTRRGARLARLLAAGQLRDWEVSPGVTERAEQVVAELAANAVLHGRVRGRDFRVTLTLDPAIGVLRIAVTDARGERRPSPVPTHRTDDPDAGRGLLLVAALTDHWGTEPYPPGGKTVWAELALRAPVRAASTPPASA